MSCELCTSLGGELLWRDAACRVVRVTENGLPGFCRVIWNAHVAEMTDLEPGARQHLMRVVFAVEAALRQTMAPDKINLASLGNVVPHLHWHVIPRFRDDAHFPAPVWAPPVRPAPARTAPATPLLRAALERALQLP
jgi:diadenosine tetraphosphate (Ap4A) HIT family hydrolase